MPKVLKTAMLSLVGLAVGSVAGGLIGVGCGLVWLCVFQPQTTGAYSGMLIFLTFMPMGIVSGAISGAIGFGTIALHDRRALVQVAERNSKS